ncbi:MAG: uracil-DNA glycosylase [Chloroflexota bacterium]
MPWRSLQGPSAFEPPLEARWPDIEAMLAEARRCVRCRLAEGRTQVVTGDGNPHALLMIVGEGPGEEEDALGRPFVGRAGRLLDRLLAEVGIDRAEAWVTNIVRCRPKELAGGVVKNRPPRADEIRACGIWMNAELSFVRPRLILCLGAIAAQTLYDKKFRLMEQHGQWFPGPYGSELMATLHPAWVLRQQGPAYEQARAMVKDDLRRLAERYYALRGGG